MAGKTLKGSKSVARVRARLSDETKAELLTDIAR
jgi:hypothetical protein